MAKINLLPQDLRVETAVDIKGVIIKTTLVVLFLGISYAYGIFLSDYFDQKHKLEEVNRQLEAYNPALANLNIYKQTRNQLSQMDAFLKEQGADRVVWSSFMKELKKNTPEGIALGELVVGDDGTFTLKGETTGFAHVGIDYLNQQDNPQVNGMAINIVKEEILPLRGPVNRYILTGNLPKGGDK